MNFVKESIFFSGIRSFFITLLGTIGIFVAIIPCIMIIAFLSEGDYKETIKNKIEILPDLNGNTKVLPINAPAILQLNIHNIITSTTADDLYYQLIESRKNFFKNNRVKAIILHINSPGGDAIASDDIYRAILNYKEKYKTPIFAYVDGLCASGGFYIACACDKIYSSTNSVIGSVGSRVGPFFNVSKIFEKWGVESSTITDGKNKDMMNPFRPWTKDEDESLKEINEFIYSNFVEIVSSSRNIEKDKIVNEFGAKVFSAKKAKEIGYIDETNMTFDNALNQVLTYVNVDIAKPYQLVTLTPKKNWFEPFLTQSKCLIENFFNKIMFSTPIKTSI
jgi:protease IV